MVNVPRKNHMAFYMFFGSLLRRSFACLERFACNSILLTHRARFHLSLFLSLCISCLPAILACRHRSRPNADCPAAENVASLPSIPSRFDSGENHLVVCVSIRCENDERVAKLVCDSSESLKFDAYVHRAYATCACSSSSAQLCTHNAPATQQP